MLSLLTLMALAPHEWITNDDYPLMALQHHHQGPVGIELLYDLSGRVSQCRVAASSGWPELDQQTCPIILKQGRLPPFTDDKGQPIVAMRHLRFNWVLPGSAGRPLPPLPPDLEIDVAALPKDTKRPAADLAVVVAVDGKVESCSIWKDGSTGSAALDKAACTTVAKNPLPLAFDKSGKPIRYLRFMKVSFSAPSAK